MMRVVCLPLDSRPCNALFPAQLARWCGGECVMPLPEEMDDFTRPASFDAARAFLERTLPRADAAVIAMDRLCFGSLLASREEGVSEAEALARLDWLAALRRRFPRLPFHSFSVIIRASISTLASGDLAAYRAMTDYAQWSDIAEETGDADTRQKALEARDRVPADVLRKYHAVRARNHAVNRRAVELTKAGAFDSLALLMEDAPAHGFHRGEQRALLRLAEGDGRIFLRNGADEGGAAAVMKALGGEPVEAEVVWLGCEDGRFTARYEDRPFRENMASALRYAGMRIVSGAARALAVACPPDGQQTECGQFRDPEALAPMAAAVDALVAAGRQVYLLDLVSANGGAFALVDRLADPMSLCGYSAWNTASNALGTAVAQLVSDARAGRVNLAFRNERFLDDLFYESCVRQALNERLRALGDDPYRLADRPRAEALLRDSFAAIRHPLLNALGPHAVSLPWARTFEARVESLPQ